MAGPTSLLVVTPGPDGRASTATLRAIVEELRSRPGIEVAVWHLRAGSAPPWPGASVLDDLRTWRPAVRLEPVGGARVGGRLADRLRGLELRRWWRRVAPDVVLLDDGLGERVVLRRRGLTLVRRCNPVPPETAGLEPGPPPAADLVIGPPGVALATGERRIASTDGVAVLDEVRRVASEAERRRTRRTFALPEDAVLVTGWAGSDGGPALDRFLAALAALDASGTAESALAAPVHGVWIDPASTPATMADLERRAAERGLADRVHCRALPTAALVVCGDVVLLPDEGAGPLGEVRSAVAGGSTVVTGPQCALADPAVVEVSVDELDRPDELAAMLREVLARDRSVAMDMARERLDVRCWVDSFLDELARKRSRPGDRPRRSISARR